MYVVFMIFLFIEESLVSKSLYLIHLQLIGVMGFGLHNKTKQKSLPAIYYNTFTTSAQIKIIFRFAKLCKNYSLFVPKF
jgi:hypothetical protein